MADGFDYSVSATQCEGQPGIVNLRVTKDNNSVTYSISPSEAERIAELMGIMARVAREPFSVSDPDIPF